MTDTPTLGHPGFFAGDPDEALAELAAGGPVCRIADADLWAVTAHQLVADIGKDPARFCSGRGVLLGDRGREIAAADSILYLDPPEHGPYRKLVSRAFTPRRVAGLEPTVRRLARDLMDRIDSTTGVDVVEALCAPLALGVIAELLGLPASDRDAFRRWSDAVMEAATDLNDENAAVAFELFVYFDAQLDAREAAVAAGDAGDDLLTVLVTAEVDGHRLTRGELLGFCMTLLVAGNETTRSLMSGGLVALADHPAQRDLLIADRALIPQAVEEMLRWVTPIMAMARTATVDVALPGADVAAGDFVALVYGAANRDRSVFGDDADRFDVTRSPNPHLAFGFGEHFCIGAGLARLEAQVLLDEILTRWPDYRVIGEVERIPSTLFRQIGSVTVVFEP